MKASFSESQKAFILKQGEEGILVADICRKAGISPAELLQSEEEPRRPVADRDASAEGA
ncbi:transposase [Bradyrhizobium sp. WSM 1744]|uniref:Transposase n=1 Tax=Bradyrhizobium archetypum TaxID=2721160 RepID=A0A7Y4HCV3_9BRAD|nr:transposase [Bradyrhizobium archetypum]